METKISLSNAKKGHIILVFRNTLSNEIIEDSIYSLSKRESKEMGISYTQLRNLRSGRRQQVKGWIFIREYDPENP